MMSLGQWWKVEQTEPWTETPLAPCSLALQVGCWKPSKQIIAVCVVGALLVFRCFSDVFYCEELPAGGYADVNSVPKWKGWMHWMLPLWFLICRGRGHFIDLSLSLILFSLRRRWTSRTNFLCHVCMLDSTCIASQLELLRLQLCRCSCRMSRAWP